MSIPVTTVVRTLVDISNEMNELELERAINEADKLDLIDPVTLASALEDFRGERGIRQLRGILERGAFRLSDSDLEILFRRIAETAGLPPPMTKEHVNGFEVDFYCPALGLVVESDGLRYHRTASTQARDRLRDQAHTAAGLTCLRFTNWQVRHRPQEVQQVLEKSTAHLPRTKPRFSD